MAKIIIRSNTAATNFIVSQKVVNININESIVVPDTNVSITPIGANEIFAEDFSTGILEGALKSISFTQLGDKVVANVSFNEFTFEQQTTVIDIPISATKRQTTSGITLIEISPIDNNLVSNTTSYGSTSSKFIARDSVVEHTVVGEVGQTVNVLSRSFIAPSGFKFVKQPSYKLSGQASGYKVKSSDTKDAKGVIIGRSFDVSYTFKDLIRTEKVNTISFSYSTKKISEPIKLATNEKEEKIYSIDTGRDIGPEGGIQVIVVRGVPGSSFRIMTQNSSNNSYNYKTGAFDNSGGFLEGVIPLARAGFGYGEFRASIRVPASTTGETVSTSLGTNKPIDHEKLVEATKDTSIRQEIENTPSTKYKKLQLNEVTLNVSAKDGGESNYTIVTPLFKDSSPTEANVLKEHEFLDYLGPLEKSGSYNFRGAVKKEIITPMRELSFGKTGHVNTLRGIGFIVMTTADNKFIRINRHPRLSTEKGAEYVRASESVGETPDKGSVGGKKILMDAGSSVRHSVTSDTSDGETIDFGSDIKFNVGLRGIGKRVEHGVSDMPDPFAYRAVMLEISLMGSLPVQDVNMEINVNNFLTIFSV